MKVKNCSILEFVSQLKDKNVICFGAGKLAVQLGRNYPDIAKKISYFIDNDMGKNGLEILVNQKTFPIYSISKLLSLSSYENVVLVISSIYFMEIIEQLNQYEKLNQLECYVFLLMEDTYKARKGCSVAKKYPEPVIPKVIHYCWFGGGKKDEFCMKCIRSWQEKCPDYEMIEWNENNFDISGNTYVKEAYQNRSFAFVSDFVRLYVLYHYGGIYLDTDIELLKSMDNFLYCDGFGGFSNYSNLQSAVLGSTKYNKVIKDYLESYLDTHFLDALGRPIREPNTSRITEISYEKHHLILNGELQELKHGVIVYPREFFSPKSYLTEQINIHANTYAIHHFTASWFSEVEKQHNQTMSKNFAKLKTYFNKKQ